MYRNRITVELLFLLTFNVNEQVKYFLLFPINIALLMKGTSLLMQSLMYTGGALSPPAVIISSTHTTFTILHDVI